MIIVTVIALGLCFYRLSVAAKIKAHLEGVANSGRPVSSAQWAARFPELPYKDNAALIYLSAFSKLDSTNLTVLWETCKDLSKLDPLQNLTEERRLTVTDSLLRNRAAIEAIKKVPQTHSQYPVQLRKGPRAKVSHRDDIDLAGTLLTLDAAVHTEGGNAIAAAESIRALLAISRSLQTEPLLKSQEVRYRWNAYAYHALQRLILHCRLQPHELENLQHSFSAAGELTDLVAAFDGERCYGIVADPRTVAREAAAVEEQPVASAMLWSFLRMTGRYEVDRLMFLQTMDQWTAFAQTPFPGRFLQAHAFEQEAYSKAKERRCFLSMGFVIAVSPAFRFEAENVARMHVAETAIAALRYKEQHGSFPERINDLSPDFLPVTSFDPFDGQSLKLKTDECFLTIYSLGKDLQDNDGLPQGQQTYRSSFDFALRLSL